MKAIPAHYEVARVSALLDMSPRWVREMIRKGQLQAHRLGTKLVVSSESINALLENSKEGTPQP